jgi:ubiquitin-conjugating enzyme E2 S
MKLVLSSDYPTSPPRGFFLTKIYHPNVANNGDICVNTLKKDWSPETTLKHVLQVIRCLLIVPFPESSLNDEAGKLFMDSYDEFARRARLMTEVHALDETEENEEATEGVDGDKEGTGSSAKVAADDAKPTTSGGTEGVSAATVFSGSDKVEEASTSTKSTSSTSSKSAKDKKRDAKKKSLKRL